MTLGTVETRVPVRLERLPRSRFHWMVVIGLVTVWILDGLEDIAKPLTAPDAEADGGRDRDEAAAPSAQRPARDLAAEATGRERERQRRYRLGPGRIGWSPGMPLFTPTAEVEFERGVSAIERALADHGPTDRRELARLVGARRWGPSRFSAAMREAIESGRPRAFRATALARPASSTTSATRAASYRP